MMKNDTKKQREFFAKKRIENKLQTLGLGLPTSTKQESTGSMDLVSLFIVNQIATKKTKSSQPKVTHFRERKGLNRARPGELLVLPMSPCSPSRLPLAEAQPVHSSTPFERERTFIKKRKAHFPLFKQPELSPVLESNLSDVSAPDYQHHVHDSFSPYSVASPLSVSSTGLFPSHQPSRTHTHTSPHPWDITQPERSQLNPYFHPSGERERDSVRWTGNGQVATPGHTHTTTTTTTMPVTRVQFGGIDTITIESRGHDTHTGNFPLGAADRSAPQEPFFRDFCRDEYSNRAPYGNEVMKIHLPEETTISTMTQEASETFMSSAVDLGGIVESQHRGAEQDLVSNMFPHADSRQGSGYEHVSVRSESPSYSPREGYDGSDSSGEEDDCCCQHNSHDALEASCIRKCVEEDAPFLNSHGTITQRGLSDAQQHGQKADKVRMAHKPGRPVPCHAAKDHGRWGGCGEDQNVPAAAPPGNTHHQSDGRAAKPPAAPPQPAPQTHEVGTQTSPIPRPTLTDASTQWCPPQDVRSTAAETEHQRYPKTPSHVPAVPPRFTRGQYEHKNELLKKASQNWLGSATTPAESHTQHTRTHTPTPTTREQSTPWQARGGAHTHTPTPPTPAPAPERNRFGPAPAGAPLHSWAQRHRSTRHACALALAVDVDQPPTPVLGARARALLQRSSSAEEVRREQSSALCAGEEDRQEGDGRQRVAEQRAEQERRENLPLSEAPTRAGERDREEAAEEEEERGVKSVSEEAQTLQEIADILLMMKRRKK
ncbi:histone-lysine N-methyltransferase SETD1A-like isoform X2 [Sardina pilchardus]|uniref:histone-lysine N-methyltransferase SETD1A-like isoform X2 n=1 Tax=Sardina pilchardus TaxID=27697 RepID=UPI002E156DF4